MVLAVASLFDSAWLKWGRAVVHMQALQQQLAIEIENLKSLGPIPARTEYDPKRHCVALKVSDIEPFPPTLALLLGDVANNFRAAVDHVAWALVTTRPKRAPKPDELTKIYFPLCRSEKAFNSHLTSKLLDDRDRKIVRRYQPFWHTARSRPHAKSKIKLHCLSVLPEINRDDKHKALRTVWAWPRSGKLIYGEPIDCKITRAPERARGIILQPDAEIHRLYVRRTGPKPDVYMEAELTVEPTFDGRVELNNWLAQTTIHIQGLLLRFAEPPKEILTLGIVPASHV